MAYVSWTLLTRMILTLSLALWSMMVSPSRGSSSLTLYYINVVYAVCPAGGVMSYWQAYKKVATTNMIVAGVVLIAVLVAAVIHPQTRDEIKRRFLS